jgi:hypothetical protein
MTAGDVVGMISVFFAGLLAGEEFVIRFGARSRALRTGRTFSFAKR